MLQQLILTNPTNAQGIKLTRENAAGLAHNLLDMRNLVRSVVLENGVSSSRSTHSTEFSIRVTCIRPGTEPQQFYEVFVKEGDYLVLKQGSEVRLLAMHWKQFKDKYQFDQN